MKNYNKFILEKIESVMIGHAVADALGVPVEFSEREELKENPVIEMMGYGAHPVEKGCWSDDTSMSLAALDSLAKGKIDYDDVMNNFVKWISKNEYTATEELFDIGMTCYKAIRRFISFGYKDALKCGLDGENYNGNGSLMRIHPFALFLYFQGKANEENIELIHNASALTHAHERSKIACGIYSFVLWELLDCQNKSSVKKGLERAKMFYNGHKDFEIYNEKLIERIGCVLSCKNVNKTEEICESEIKSSGYVLDTIEAAIWCVLTTNSYKECVLKAVNLGGDTDTVAAVAGGLAGALYGIFDIPKKWVETLLRRDYILDVCKRAALEWS